ncbi:septum formation initiator family protein [Candidatus Uhrbacteria bacterium]|nr:septum formation initiator family protein [Candidatus Uhrbacteria bacterium]
MSRLTSFFSSKLFFAAGLCLLAFVVYQLGRISLVRYDMNTDIRELEKESESLEQNQQRLLKLQEFLSTDFFAEREARLKLGMQKKGENVALVHPPETASVSDEDLKKREVTRSEDGNSLEEERKKKNPELWWDYFFANPDK